MKIIQIKNKPLRALVSILAVLVMIAAGLGTVGGVFYLIGSQFGLLGLMASPEKAGLVADVVMGFATLLAIVIVLLVLSAISLVVYGWIKKLYNGPFGP